MQIHIINLDRRKDRWDKIVQNISSVKNSHLIDYHRFSAYDGLKLNITPEYCHLLRNNTYKMRRAVLAYALGCIDLWKKLLESDQPGFCIMDDDINFCPNFYNKLQNTVTTLKDYSYDKFDICFIGYMLPLAMERKNPQKYNKIEAEMKLDLLKKHPYYSGTFGYIISRRGAENMLNLINKHGVNYPIDTMILYAMTGRYPGFKILCTLPRLVFTNVATLKNNVDTDIQRDMTKVSFDNLELVTTDPVVLEKFPELIDFLKNNFVLKKLDQIPDPPQNNQIFLSTMGTTSQIPKSRHKIPIIYIITDPKLIQLETLPKDSYFLCVSSKIQNVINYARKSNFELLNTGIYKDINNYYFNYWKTNY
jgi:GR25 family glycosyltransferase involved in LPS biosynthesis